MIEQFFQQNKKELFELNNEKILDFGSYVWIPKMQVDNPHILEISRDDTNYHDHECIKYKVVKAGKNHFNRKHTSQLPIHAMQLEDNQELLISPAKRRLCIVLGKFKVSNHEISMILNKEQQEYAKHLSNMIYIVAPLYSCSTASEPTSFCPEITDRIKNFIYPHLFYLPKYQNTAQNNQFAALSSLSSAGSIIRLDEMFSFLNYESASVEKYKLTLDAFKLIHIHIQYMFEYQEPLIKFRKIIEKV
jgi:hypothetical protein